MIPTHPHQELQSLEEGFVTAPDKDGISQLLEANAATHGEKMDFERVLQGGEIGGVDVVHFDVEEVAALEL